MERELVIHFNQFAWPLASGIELASSLAEIADDVRFVFAGHAVPERGLFLPAPRTLARLLRVSLPEPQLSREGNLALLSLPTYRSGQSTPWRLSGWQQFAEESNWETLQEVSARELPAGRAVANYIVRRAGTRQVNLSEMKQRIRFLLFSYCETIELTWRLIREHRSQQVHVYQGNWLNDRAVADAASSLGVAYSTYGEVAPGYYWRWSQDPYLMDSWRTLDVLSRWSEATKGKGSDFKDSIRCSLIQQSSSPDWNPFSTRDQAADRPLPECSYVSFFTANTSDERFGLDHGWEPHWSNQVAFVLQLWDRLRSNGDALVVRVHPNNARKPICEQQPWIELEQRVASGELPGLAVIPASSRVDSYALAAGSQAAVTWGSNIAIELVARGIPTVNVAPAAYDSICALPVASTMTELLHHLQLANVTVEAQERATAWLWFIATQWTIPFSHVSLDYDRSGNPFPVFRGCRLDASVLSTRLSRPWAKARSAQLLARTMAKRYRIGL